MVNLLIVDDEKEVLEHLKYIVSSERFADLELICVSSARDAKIILQTQVIDILLTDINMPVFNGFELANIAKENNSECWVIFLTSFDKFDYAYNALKAGYEDFILKINTNEEIISSISRAISGILVKKKQSELLHTAQQLLKTTITSQENNSDVITKIKKFISDNLDKDISLNLLSTVVYLSPAYISKTFKNNTSVTITEYLLKCRIEKAKELLKNPDVKVQDVALMVGFDSPPYFGKLFKKKVGSTPQEYRRNSQF